MSEVPEMSHSTPRREGELLPWERRWDEPRSGTASQMPDNAVTEKPLLYGPSGEVLMKVVPRPVGFRKPEAHR